LPLKGGRHGLYTKGYLEYQKDYNRHVKSYKIRYNRIRKIIRGIYGQSSHSLTEKTSGGRDASVEVQQTRVRHGGFPLPERCSGDLRQPDQWTPARRNLDEQREPGHKCDHRREHGDCWDSKPPPPPHVLLDIHHGSHGCELRELDAEEVEIEEAPLGLCAPWPAVRVQLALVGTEGHDAGSGASGADGRAEQRQVEHDELDEGRRALAVGGVLGAGRRAERGEHGGGRPYRSGR
jgi:hypothetical protein